jgi:hypothetical protein
VNSPSKIRICPTTMVKKRDIMGVWGCDEDKSG